MRFIKNTNGATAIEYALIAAFIFLAIVGAVAATGTSLQAVFTKVKDGFPTP